MNAQISDADAKYVDLTYLCPSQDRCHCLADTDPDISPDEHPGGRIGPSLEEISRAKNALLNHSVHDAEEATNSKNHVCLQS